MRNPIEMLIRLKQRDNSQEIVDWLAEGFEKWLDHEIHPCRALGLPGGSPNATRTDCRDFYLSLAADLHGGSSKEVFDATKKFKGHQWVSWCTKDDPPTHATEFERALFIAMKYNDNMPGLRRFQEIICAEKHE